MKHFKQLFLLCGAAALMAGCASAPSHFYTLDATATGGGAPPAKYGVVVGPVFIPAAVDRPQFVVTTAPNQVELDEFNRWTAPLGESIARVVSLDLATLLSAPVASAPMPGFSPAYRVTLRVERMESAFGDGKQQGKALMDVVWVLRGSKDQGISSGHSVVSEPVAGNDFAALAAAHSRALAKVSEDIAHAIQLAAQ